MKIFVKVKLKAKKEQVKIADPKLFESNENHFEVFVKEPPLEGRANKRIIQLLAEYFKIHPPKINPSTTLRVNGDKNLTIKIIQGFKSREKVLEINN